MMFDDNLMLFDIFNVITEPKLYQIIKEIHYMYFLLKIIIARINGHNYSEITHSVKGLQTQIPDYSN